jgi:hypothetical protein
MIAYSAERNQPAADIQEAATSARSATRARRELLMQPDPPMIELPPLPYLAEPDRLFWNTDLGRLLKAALDNSYDGGRHSVRPMATWTPGPPADAADATFIRAMHDAMRSYGEACARAALEAAAERVKDLDAYCGGHGMPNVPGSSAYVKAILDMKVKP